MDRLPRRRILIVTDLGQALVLGTIPLVAILGILTLAHLYVVAFLSGVCALWFEVAYHALLPALVARDRLPEANSKLETSRSLAEIIGPGLAGTFIQVLTAPISIAADSLSFLVSAFFLRRLSLDEAPPPISDQPHLWREIREGLELVVRNPLIRPLALSALTLNFFGGIHDALFVLYITRQLGLSPIFYGLYYAVGSVSGLAAAFLSNRLAKRYGLGRLLLVGALLIGVGWLAFPLAALFPALALALMTLKALIGGFGNTTYNIADMSFAQAAIPGRLLGRYDATEIFLTLGLLPLGALIGGLLGSVIGLIPTLIIGMIGSLTAFLWILFSPLRRLRQPEPIT